MTKLVIIICVLGVGFNNFCYGQSQAIFDKINRSNGLSNNRIKTIVKESDGFVWIGTNNGLNRYDGYDVKIYNQQNSNLTSNDITDILIDTSNRIWVATSGGGLNLYDSDNDNFEVYRNDPNDKSSIPSNNLNILYEDKKGNIWIGTENGFCLYNSSSNEFITWLSGFSSGVTCFLETKQGLLIGTFGDGLKMYDQDAQILTNIFENNSDLNFIHALDKLNEDEILIGTSGSGLLLINTKTKQVSNFLNEKFKYDGHANIIRTIKNDGDGNLWIGTDGNGVLNIVNPNSEDFKVKKYIHNPQMATSLSGNAIYDILIDEKTNVWVGTAWNGMNFLNRNENVSIILSDSEGEVTAAVLSIYKTTDRFLMGLDGGGLTIRENNTGKSLIKKENEAGGSYIQYIMQASDGTYWLGTFANGLINFDINKGVLKKFQSKNEQNSLNYNDIRYVIEDGENNLWVASWEGGLSYLDTKTDTFTHYKKLNARTNSISSNNLVSLQKDGKYLWIATFGGGVNLFDTQSKEFKQFRYEENKENSLSSDNTFSILKDSKGYVWIGTAGNGVNRYDPYRDKIERFEDYEIIRYASVVSIIEDRSGKIWFGTKDGILNFDYDKNKFNGFPNLHDEFHINSAFIDEAGVLYFGGLRGVMSFDPANFYNSEEAPKVLITDFKLYNRSVSIDKEGILRKNILLTDNLRLPHNLDVVTFNFAALQYPFSLRRQYAIKMENFDAEWRNIGKERTATYTNLPYGDYTFKVKSREKGMDWSSKEASIEIEILKPYWLEWWAYLIYLLFLFVLFYFLRKYTIAWERMKANLKLEQITNEKNKELHNIKQRFFMNISHEIRTPLTLIMGALNGLGKVSLSTKDQKRLTTVDKNATRLMDLVEELLNFRKLEAGSIELEIAENDMVGFLREIYLAFGQKAIDNDIDFQFHTSSEKIQVWFDKKQLEKTIFNITSNAFKFTPPGGQIKIAINIVKKKVCIRITDTGEGIPKEKLSKIFNRFYQNAVTEKSGFGIGLSIAHEIIKLHSGSIKVKSVEGKGSEFIILLPMDKAPYPKEVINHDKGRALTGPETSNVTDDVVISENNESAETILVVEDHEELRQYICEVLLDQSYELIEATNGMEGLNMAMKHIPDLIISDIMMPQMDGMAFCESIKTNIGTSHIPVILLTARTSIDDKVKSYGIGADDYITKPFKEPLLLAKIKSLLHNRELIRNKFKTDGLILPKELALNRTDQGFLEKLTELIENNLDAPDFGANQLSREMGMSHSVLYKKIKALSGMNLIEFIRDYKLRIAKRVLEEQRYSVSEVCFMVGYSDRKYFRKVFKQKFGKNPSDILK
ncbi:two-component regulator propeller domain-containing protein [Maribacter sp. 2304DJ31-5]|uniref:hybrid sensor histidine kinase/response regulator transcription factor n=1 Tax=Maribacter sp. 2304DJ31-5 TaxID=3386273 RepID=UPI0039BD198D